MVRRSLARPVCHVNIDAYRPRSRAAARACIVCSIWVAACSPAKRAGAPAPADLPRPVGEPSSGSRPRPVDPLAYDVEPEFVAIDDPEYPAEAREQGVEGTVLVRVLVGTDGLVKDAIVVHSVVLLDEPSLKVAWSAVFKPGTLKGKPVAVWMVFPIEYKLRERHD